VLDASREVQPSDQTLNLKKSMSPKPVSRADKRADKGVQRCPVYEKHNRFYADWRDKKGLRRRRAFTTARQAEAFELTQKAVAHPKSKARPSSAQRSRVSSSPSLLIKKEPTPSTTRSKASSLLSGRKVLAISSHSTLRPSSKTSRTTNRQPATSITPTLEPCSVVSQKTTVRRMVCIAKSRDSTNPPRAIGSSRRRREPPS
jgi:hypothetical protein